MMEETLNRAEQYLEQLRTLYADYRREEPEEESGLNLGRLFKGWFSSGIGKMEPEDRRFVDGAEELSGQLAEAIGGEPEGETRRSLAVEAVTLILDAGSPNPGTGKELYLTAAEQYCIPLLKYLSGEDLARLKSSMLAKTPKRMMFPKQLEVLEAMERLMAAFG